MPKSPESDFELVKELSRRYSHIVGVDEVGRGALAGPMVVTAIEINFYVEGVNDSKLLSRSARENLEPILKAKSLQLGFGEVSNREIDELGISKSLKLAYERALKGITADLILTDNVFLPDWPHFKSIKGDQIFYPTAAASILAKVYRDRLMRKLHQEFPMYNWKNNVGYGTKKHLDGIKKNGLCSWHRRSFGGIG
jgi:ribonuclease HII